MCLTRYFETRRAARDWIKNPSIAKKDIEVYKVFQTTPDPEILKSPYQYYLYDRGFLVL